MSRSKDDIQFISVPMVRIYPERPLPGDIYLFIGGKFLKFKTGGDEISSDKYDLFLYKRIKYLFINSEDRSNYLEWTDGLESDEKETLVQAAGEENQEVVELHLEVKDDVMDFVSKEITESSVKEMVDKTRDFIHKMQEKKGAEAVLIKLLSYGQSLADHAVNVANISSFIALSIGYGQQVLLENIYLGALLHDYGKTEIDPAILEQKGTPEYKKAMRRHPEQGKTALMLDEGEAGFSNEVYRIIGEHHENHDGSGYPKGLKRNNIYDLSKIVSIADTFDNAVRSADGEDLAARQRQAFKVLLNDDGKIFDPKILAKALRCLEQVI